ncbi:MAG: hypothetical protein ABIP66_02515 [Gemmatimonadaceae bacterium]
MLRIPKDQTLDKSTARVEPLRLAGGIIGQLGKRELNKLLADPASTAADSTSPMR